MGSPMQALLFCLFTADVKVSSGTLDLYRSSHGTDFDNSDIAGPVTLDPASSQYVGLDPLARR